ncbi:hypothetical protein [Streptomyces nymphaeiformis]|uniref:Uncharacterized protein n=1 Tax=Streptomyces nymphaeiformis TaxID=2663842 RepID=A0A7W7U5F0_9ACTN|nr:hypothetical protein [Streptomyces nymphaeiformis]MBB4984986.1 hypothetical protein [Streptomyces nymphaeiformis]
MTSRVTTEQLLNLADRAERGPLTATEASRLRTGIAELSASKAALADSKASLEGRLAAYADQPKGRAIDGLKAVQRLVAGSERRGVTHLPVWAIAAASGAPIPKPPPGPDVEHAREGA